MDDSGMVETDEPAGVAGDLEDSQSRLHGH